MACAAGLCPGACVGTSSAQARRVSAQAFETVELEEAPVAIVMGLDQQRPQIAADWLDADTGEVGRARVAPADRADARHLRELLIAGRLPESWVAPDQIRDLRARVRLRHTLSEQRGEWQQPI